MLARKVILSETYSFFDTLHVHRFDNLGEDGIVEYAFFQRLLAPLHAAYTHVALTTTKKIRSINYDDEGFWGATKAWRNVHRIY